MTKRPQKPPRPGLCAGCRREIRPVLCRIHPVTGEDEEYRIYEPDGRNLHTCERYEEGRLRAVEN